MINYDCSLKSVLVYLKLKKRDNKKLLRAAQVVGGGTTWAYDPKYVFLFCYKLALP